MVHWRAVQILRLHLAAWQVTTVDKIHGRAQSTTALVWYAQQVSWSCHTAIRAASTRIVQASSPSSIWHMPGLAVYCKDNVLYHAVAVQGFLSEALGVAACSPDAVGWSDGP